MRDRVLRSHTHGHSHAHSHRANGRRRKGLVRGRDCRDCKLGSYAYRELGIRSICTRTLALRRDGACACARMLHAYA
jgi:hypothetical protein